ncbi:MAG TPA: PspA/IM30 family protein [Myxococcota bacterium]|nr:PspA/IM30 family protein [Myxococcales bacterium]HPG27290.1 PspA/IM30 family protein [Myxococcota bacterium]
MSESLTTRVGRIVSGSLNALVGALEDAAPEVVLSQAIREVDAAISDVRAELGRELAKKHLASTRLMEVNRRHDELSERIDLALGEGREDLAEAAASQQLDLEAQIPVIERHLSECGDRESELEGLIAALQARKRDMREEMRVFLETVAKPSASPGKAGATSAAPGAAASDRADRATSAFDEILERNAGIPGSRQALENEKKLAELEELAHKNRVRERIAAAKARRESA